MAGRPKSRGRVLSRSGRRLSRRAAEIIGRSRERRAASRASRGGCSTSGYYPQREFDYDGVPERLREAHLAKLPAFLPEEGVISTGWGRRKEILTFCRGGRLVTMVQED